MAPIQATIYEMESLRCNLCGASYTAPAPEGDGYRLEAALGPDDSHLLDDYQVTISMPELVKSLPEDL